MPTPTHQTIRLSRGQHLEPADGACVMELASMLAGERFSDHPRAVCPVIATVLRAYNDGIDDDRRQDLYACAAAVVGTRDRTARRARLSRCLEFFGESDTPVKALLRPRLQALGLAALDYARSAGSAEHRALLALVDELASDGAPVIPAAAPTGLAGSSPSRRRSTR